MHGSIRSLDPMTQHPRIVALLATTILATACSAPQRSAAPTPAAIAETPGLATEAWRAPHDACKLSDYTAYSAPSQPVFHPDYGYEDPDMLYEDLIDNVGEGAEEGTIELEVHGAPAGAVLEEIGYEFDAIIVSAGHGAQVPIYAYIDDDRTWRQAVEDIAAAAGMQVWEHQGALFVMDAELIARKQRAIAATRTPLPALGTRLHQSEHPHTIARAIASTVLDCRGKTITSPSSETIVIHATEAQHVTIEALLDALKNRKEISLEIDAERRTLYGVPQPHVPICDRGDATFSPYDANIGDALIDFAIDSEVNAVIGCGASAKTFVSDPEEGSFDAMIATTELRAVRPGVFANAAIATAHKKGVVSPQKDTLRTIITKNAGDAADVAAAFFGDDIELSSYPENDIVIARGDAARVKQAAEFIATWSAQQE